MSVCDIPDEARSALCDLIETNDECALMIAYQITWDWQYDLDPSSFLDKLLTSEVTPNAD